EMFKEPTAPLVGDTLVMGSSVQWYSEKSGEEELFPEFSYGVSFNPQNAEPVTMGEWTWETGMHLNQITQAEVIRDYGLLVVFSNWSVLKNDPLFKDKYNSRKLAWVAYIAGKRESRRLIGDHILTENDIRNFVEYPDGTGSTTWSIDLHYPDSVNKLKFPDNPFKSVARHIPIYPYPIPYRCLYSKDIKNLFMAGRNISVSHVALGTVRVMRTTGILGEVVGMAASLCVKYKAVPRQVYTNHLDELKGLMRVGVGQNDLPNNQQYNEGATLLVPPRPYTK
ncbi:MAG: FAD-dependent oxidoreductase, partial [Tannerellaceae bacterium]